MSLSKNIMGGGTGAGQADAFESPTAGLVAAGTTQATATALNADINVIDTVSSGTGVILFNAMLGDSQDVYNGGANPLKIYPPVGSTINQLGTNSAMTLATNTACTLKKVAATRWIANVSA